MPIERLGVFDTGTIVTAYITGAVTRGQRVNLSGDSAGNGAPTAVVADHTTFGVGVVEEDQTPVSGVSTSNFVPVRLYNNGSCPFLTSTSVALTDTLYPSDAGCVANVQAGGGAGALGTPMRATVNSGDIIKGVVKLLS